MHCTIKTLGGGYTERAASGDGPHGPITVSELGRDSQGPLLADAHVEEVLVPSAITRISPN